jgi:hypothetical protein
MVKQLMHDNENVTIVNTRYYDGANTMVRWWNCDDMMIKTRYYFDHCVIASSWFHHRAIIVSSSYHCAFTFVPSCIAVQGDKNVTCVQTQHRNQAIFERYNIVTCFASRRNLKSRFASRTLTRDKKSFEAIYFLIVIPLFSLQNWHFSKSQKA